MMFSSHKVKWVTVFVCLAAAAVLLTCGEKGTGPNSPTPAIPVEAKFGTSSATGAPPLTVQFTDSSAGSPDFWFWRFGDGESSFDQHPSHEYDQEGDYDVSLVVSRGEVKDSILRVGLISVDDSATALTPSAGFIADPLTGRAPLLVQFTNQSSGTISSYAWDFGDGGSSTAASVAHLYMAEGRYTVRLIVSGAGGADTIRMVNYITVTVAAPNAAFTAAPTSGQPPLSVTFTNQSTGSITGYKWYFGDGDSSTVQNPVHMYDAAGLYSVTLIAVGPGGADTNRVANYIAVSTGRPIAAFTGAPTQGTTPLTVQFTNNSAGNITSYLWSFGDSSSSTLEDPNHLYTFAGQYTIRLIATGPGGSDTTSRVNYITVRSAPPVVHFSGTPTTGLVPLDVSFNNTTTGEVTGYNWSFGDGVTSTLANPSHRYNTGGLYTVRLIATGPGGVDTLIRSNYITATWPRPTAAFTGAPTTGVVPFNVNFTNNSTGQISSYLWTFGDGGTSTSASPAHDYTVPGIYSVRLIATGPGGADTLTRANYVTAQYPRPIAGFTGLPTQGTVPFAVNFANSSIGEITSYAWTFGDGGTSNEANPSHSYTAHGSYDVRLIVSGPGGVDTLVRPGYITANAVAPTAEFTSDRTSGNVPLNVQFTDLSTGNITSWNWRFGTVGSSNERNPDFTFATPGSHDIRLIVAGPGGVDTILKVAYITALPPVPVAQFGASPTNGDAPLTVTFTNSSTSVISSYEWDFGDGGTSLLAAPTHQYAVAGVYSVRLIVTGPGGADTLTRSSLITVTTPRPVADFSGNPISGVSPLTVQFTSSSSGEIDFYHWTFGDGVSSNSQNPSHEYAAEGIYDVQLIVLGPGGEDTLLRPAYIDVAPPAPVASFDGSPTSGPAPLAVQFNDLSTGSISSYEWDFGDGGNSTAQNPLHSYDTPGTYTVSLTVNGPGGSNSSQRTDFITVLIPPPSSDFSANPLSGVAPLLVNFTSLATGQIDSYDWEFGDGETSTEQNPQHTYAAPGVYSVRLIVNGPGGSDTLQRVDYITALVPPPTSDFSAVPLSGVAPLGVDFTGLATGQIDSYFWEFGDGNTSSSQSPSHVYDTQGSYSVRLTVNGPGGSDVLQRDNYITVNVPAPTASFSADPLSGIAPLDVSFTNSSSGQIDSYAWEFGDGGTSTEASPQHTYQDPGSYSVRLIVTGVGGADTSFQQDMISVSNGGPTASFDADPLAGVAPLDVQFSDHSTGVILTRFWDFGDGQTSLVTSPLHQYQNPGSYTVTLAVVGLVGVDTLRRVDYIVVNEPPPVAGFSANQTTGIAPLDVQFTNSSTGTIDSFEWDFGDGNGSVDKEPLHTYQDPGVYSVRLIVVGPGGADTTRITDYISVLAIDGAGLPTNSSKPTIQRSNAGSITPTPSAATITRKE